MEVKHYKEELSAFVHDELTDVEQLAVADHLMTCDGCHREHDLIKMGAAFAAELKQADAPDAAWANIADALDAKTAPQMGLIPEASFFNLCKGFSFAFALIAVSALVVLVWVGLFSGESPYAAQGNRIRVTDVNSSQTISQNAGNEVNIPADQTETNINTSNTNQQPIPATKEVWQVETIAGTPRVGDRSATAKITVGELLETDAASSARISVPDIGTVDIAPSSRVKLVETGKAEHRLSLEKGKLYAKIFAPPRLFVVDTPAGKAVDLGCEYTLEVDAKGDSILNVTSGFVALERGGRESIVPAGMMCRMRKRKGVGTPFSAASTAKFRNALERFDFSGGGSSSISEVLAEADLYDMVTLWHLLSRVPKTDRGAVFDELSKFVGPPTGVTREGIIALDKKMLEVWREAVEAAWFS